VEVEEILGALRAEGLRATVQRRVVIAALLGGPRHVTAEELTATVHAENPEIAKSTIYRTLEALERQEVIHHAHLGHGPAVYHLSTEDHLHLVCVACGKVTEVPRGAYARFTRMLAETYEFSAAPHHFAVHGRCASCADAEALAHNPGDGDEATRRHAVHFGP
jgi:Fe2+ or Zn2+ uptake regulation protein